MPIPVMPAMRKWHRTVVSGLKLHTPGSRIWHSCILARSRKFMTFAHKKAGQRKRKTGKIPHPELVGL